MKQSKRKKSKNSHKKGRTRNKSNKEIRIYCGGCGIVIGLRKQNERGRYESNAVLKKREAEKDEHHNRQQRKWRVGKEKFRDGYVREIEIQDKWGPSTVIIQWRIKQLV